MAGTITGANLLLRIEDTLQDTTNVRWSEAELLRYINDAQREIVNLRPDASADHANVQLATGTEQAIPDVGLRLIKVVRNMSAAGGSATGKRTIRIVDREILDTLEPDWHDPAVTGDAAHTTVVKHYIFDEDDPRKYYVYPGVSGNAYVEIVFSRSPTDLANTSATLYIDDIYANAVIDYALYRAYMKDAEFAGNAQRAQSHYQLFANSIGAGAQVNTIISPNVDIARSVSPAAAPLQPGAS